MIEVENLNAAPDALEHSSPIEVTIEHVIHTMTFKEGVELAGKLLSACGVEVPVKIEKLCESCNTRFDLSHGMNMFTQAICPKCNYPHNLFLFIKKIETKKENT